MCCERYVLVKKVVLLRAMRAVHPGIPPQVLQRYAPKAAPELGVVGKQEKLPALLQFSLDLNSSSKTIVTRGFIDKQGK